MTAKAEFLPVYQDFIHVLEVRKITVFNPMTKSEIDYRVPGIRMTAFITPVMNDNSES
jgi:hypothetical protein